MLLLENEIYSIILPLCFAVLGFCKVRRLTFWVNRLLISIMMGSFFVFLYCVENHMSTKEVMVLSLISCIGLFICTCLRIQRYKMAFIDRDFFTMPDTPILDNIMDNCFNDFKGRSYGFIGNTLRLPLLSAPLFLSLAIYMQSDVPIVIWPITSIMGLISVLVGYVTRKNPTELFYTCQSIILGILLSLII